MTQLRSSLMCSKRVKSYKIIVDSKVQINSSWKSLIRNVSVHMDRISYLF